MGAAPKYRDLAIGIAIAFVIFVAGLTGLLLNRSETPQAAAPASQPAAEAARSPAISPIDAQAIAKLDRKLPEIKFDAVSFSDVIDFFQDVSASKITVDWDALTAAGVDRATPVTARLRDVKFSKALDVILRDVGADKVRLSYSIRNGAINIATEDILAQTSGTR